MTMITTTEITTTDNSIICPRIMYMQYANTIYLNCITALIGNNTVPMQ